MIQVRIKTGATIRQWCLLCDGQTWKHAVQAFYFVDGHDVPSGAVCEHCLCENRTTRPEVTGDVPTYAALRRERQIFDWEEEQYYVTGTWPNLESRRRKAGKVWKHAGLRSSKRPTAPTGVPPVLGRWKHTTQVIGT